MTIFEKIMEFIRNNSDIPITGSSSHLTKEEKRILDNWGKNNETNIGIFAVYKLCEQFNATHSKKFVG